MNEFLRSFLLTKEEVKPVSRGARRGAWFIVAVGAMGALGAIVFGLFLEKDPRILVMLLPPLFSMYLFGHIASTGYAPKYLLFAHEPKDD
jgi:predicted MFS family arabinose efflux permease